MANVHPPGFWNRLLGRSDIMFDDSVYMRRWRILNTPWFGVRIHHILRSDNDRVMHDHPFSFLSIILWGGYCEWRPLYEVVPLLQLGLYTHCDLMKPVFKWFGPGSILYRRAEALHRLELPSLPADAEKGRQERSAWTLVFRGPVRRGWGFQTKEGWMPAKEFMARPAEDRSASLPEDL